MNSRRPQVILLGGPNGAGKTTISREVLATTLGITEFVNADAIAAGLSGFSPERAAFAAGRVMLARLHELGAATPPRDFAFESTLASRTFAPWLSSLVDRGFEVHVLYVWLRTPELAIRRVKARVRQGGHDIPPEVVRRRYVRSASNLLHLYLPIAERAGTWRIYDNSTRSLRWIASGGRGRTPIIKDARAFGRLQEVARGKVRPEEEDGG